MTGWPVGQLLSSVGPEAETVGGGAFPFRPELDNYWLISI